MKLIFSPIQVEYSCENMKIRRAKYRLRKIANDLYMMNETLQSLHMHNLFFVHILFYWALWTKIENDSFAFCYSQVQHFWSSFSLTIAWKGLRFFHKCSFYGQFDHSSLAIYIGKRSFNGLSHWWWCFEDELCILINLLPVLNPLSVSFAYFLPYLSVIPFFSLSK